MPSNLETLHDALTARSIACTLSDEDSFILSFTATPLSYTLRIAGHRTSTIVLVLNLSTCVTLLYARSHGATQAASDRTDMLVEAGYVGVQEEDDFMPQIIRLYDLSKVQDRTALVKRILLMRDLERKFKAPFEEGKWMGKQKSFYSGYAA
ncbi:hypothetical protein DPSP01_002920 [Paraphaeosphaeria sporulosa]